jgi:ElaB/YqjD/DUF883 family membrane-anchored ribosome-binding protein
VPKQLLETFVMASSAKTNPDVETRPDLEVILNDIASLKRDLAELIGHVKTGATEGTRAAARNAVEQIGDEASRAYERLAAQGERSVKAISRQVEEQPIMSLLLAFAIGFIGSRMLSR